MALARSAGGERTPCECVVGRGMLRRSCAEL